jgi:hypothetical protein
LLLVMAYSPSAVSDKDIVGGLLVRAFVQLLKFLAALCPVDFTPFSGI